MRKKNKKKYKEPKLPKFSIWEKLGWCIKCRAERYIIGGHCCACGTGYSISKNEKYENFQKR